MTYLLIAEEPGHLPVYNWYPAALANSNASAEYLAYLLRQHVAENDASDKLSLKEWINTKLVIQGLGITDARPAELDALADSSDDATYVFAEMVSLRAHIGWSTHGHSAVDVNIYSSGGFGAEKIRGNVENTDVGRFLRSYLDVDVDSITDELREKMGGEHREAFNTLEAVPGNLPGYTPGGADFAGWMYSS